MTSIMRGVGGGAPKCPNFEDVLLIHIRQRGEWVQKIIYVSSLTPISSPSRRSPEEIGGSW